MEIEESKDPKAKKNFIANDIRNLVADKLKLSQTNFKNIIDSDSNDSEQKKEIVYSIYQYQQSTNSRGQNLVDENGILDEKTKAQLIKSIKPSSPSLVPKPSHSN
jgi:hypothetical protein